MKMKIAIAAVILAGLTALPQANALTYDGMSSADGSGSGTSYSTSSYSSGTSYSTGSGTSYTTDSGSGTSYSSGSSYTPGDISMGSGSGYDTGSGCTYGCTVPEPESFFLMGIGLLGLYLARRR